jgi:hypothetical protein
MKHYPTLYALAEDLAAELTKIDDTRKWTAEARQKPNESEPHIGIAWLTSNDGYSIYMRNGWWFSFNRENDKIEATPETPKKSDGRYYQCYHEQPVINFSAKRPVRTIARDIQRRLLPDLMRWTDRAKADMEREEALKAKQETYKQMLVDTFGANAPSHNDRDVYGKGWRAIINSSGNIQELKFDSSLTIDQVMTLVKTYNATK